MYNHNMSIDMNTEYACIYALKEEHLGVNND